jgi:RNA polymerase sigma factor (sigma-70 family)
MRSDLPPDLALLLDSPDPASRERAWAAFLARYNRLLLKAASAFGGGYDARMDRYRFLVESLAAEECRRLRAYHVQARSSFPSWLTVVARRLCVDFERNRTGRSGRATSDAAASEARRQARRRLAELAGAKTEPDDLPSPVTGVDDVLSDSDRHSALESAMATLEPRDRLLLRLRFEDDVPMRRIGEILAMPTVFHVYRRLNVVLIRLRQALKERGIEGAG